MRYMKKNALLLAGILGLLACQEEEENINTFSQFSEVCEFRTEILAPEGYQIETVGTFELDGNPRQLQFVTDELGYILATKNFGGYVEVLKTTDGGQTWTSLDINIEQSPTNMVFRDENYGLITVHDVSGCPPPNCLNKCVILRTENGGDDWEEIELEELRGILYHPTFDDEGNLYANLMLGEQSTLMKSEDNGVSWDTLFASTELDFRLVTFSFELFQDKLFVSGEDGKLLVVATDGTLEKVIEIDSGPIWDLEIIDENNMIAVLSDKTLRTTDGGTSWETMYEESARMIGFDSADQGLMFLRKSVCPTDVYQVNDVIAATNTGGLNWNEAAETTTNLRVSYTNSQKMSEGHYYSLIGNRLISIKPLND